MVTGYPIPIPTDEGSFNVLLQAIQVGWRTRGRCPVLRIIDQALTYIYFSGNHGVSIL